MIMAFCKFFYLLLYLWHWLSPLTIYHCCPFINCWCFQFRCDWWQYTPYKCSYYRYIPIWWWTYCENTCGRL